MITTDALDLAHPPFREAPAALFLWTLGNAHVTPAAPEHVMTPEPDAVSVVGLASGVAMRGAKPGVAEADERVVEVRRDDGDARRRDTGRHGDVHPDPALRAGGRGFESAVSTNAGASSHLALSGATDA